MLRAAGGDIQLGRPLWSGNSLGVHCLGFDGREVEDTPGRDRETPQWDGVFPRRSRFRIARDCAITRQDTEEKPEPEREQRARDIRRDMGPEMGAQDEPGSLGRRHPCGLCARMHRRPSWGPGPESSAGTQAGSSRPSGLGAQGRDGEESAGRETAQRAGQPPAAHPHPWSMLPATRIVNKAGVCRVGCPGPTGGAEWPVRSSLMAEGRSQQPNVRGETPATPATNGPGGWVRIRGLVCAEDADNYCPGVFR